LISNLYEEKEIGKWRGILDCGVLAQVTTYTASVDPGRAWLTMGWGGVGGTAILCPGQYMDAYEVGLHNAKYEALLQRLPVKVWRDNDRDGKLDFGTDGV
jgi:hypothetical protein